LVHLEAQLKKLEKEIETVFPLKDHIPAEKSTETMRTLSAELARVEEKSMRNARSFQGD
jgi:hypothetical protein